MLPVPQDHPLRKLFAGLVENTFYAEVGIGDPELMRYLADLLVDFSHIEELNLLCEGASKDLDTLAAMLSVALGQYHEDDSKRDYQTYRHIGDFSLFWAGVYPEHLKRKRYDNPDLLLDYIKQGKRSYAIVADLADEQARPPAHLFEQLSEEFESCVYGLALVRRSWENPDGDLTGGPPHLLH